MLVYESPGAEVMSFPDNITVSPRGALVVCEDPLANDFHRLIGVTHDTRTFELCQTEQGVEWAGATFAPDGRTLFANLQGSTVGNVGLRGTFEPGGPSRSGVHGNWARCSARQFPFEEKLVSEPPKTGVRRSSNEACGRSPGSAHPRVGS